MDDCKTFCRKIGIVIFAIYSIISLSTLLAGFIGLCTSNSNYQFKMFVQLTLLGIVTSSLIGIIILLIWLYNRFCKTNHNDYYENL